MLSALQELSSLAFACLLLEVSFCDVSIILYNASSYCGYVRIADMVWSCAMGGGG